MRHMDVVTTYNMGYKIPKWENVLKTLFYKTISPKFLVVRGRKWYKWSTWNFDMALNLDKYTSWYDPCIDKILDSDPYISTSWIGSLYIYCEPKVPMSICTITNEVWMNFYIPIHLPGLLIIIVNDCSWSNNLCIMAVDKWSIEYT